MKPIRRTIILEYPGNVRKVVVEETMPGIRSFKAQSPICSRSEEWLIKETRKHTTAKVNHARGLTADPNLIHYTEAA